MLYAMSGTDANWLAEHMADRKEHVRYWAIRLVVDSGSNDEAHAALLLRRAQVETSGLARMALASVLPVVNAQDRWSLGLALAPRSTHGEDANFLRFAWMGWLKPSQQMRFPRSK